MKGFAFCGSLYTYICRKFSFNNNYFIIKIFLIKHLSIRKFQHEFANCKIFTFHYRLKPIFLHKHLHGCTYTKVYLYFI